MNPKRLQQCARDWRWQLTAREILYATGAACLVGSVAAILAGFPLLVGVLAFAAILGGRMAINRPWRFDAVRLTQHLNRSHPELEESSALWLRARNGLTTLEQLQLTRLESALTQMEGRPTSQSPLASPPRVFLRRAWQWLFIGLIFLTATGIWVNRRGTQTHVNGSPFVVPAAHDTAANNQPKKEFLAMPRIVRAGLTVDPPSYTGRARRQVNGFSAEIEEGAQVTWHLVLDKPLSELHIVIGENGNESAAFASATKGTYDAHGVLHETALAHLAGTLSDGTAWNPSELYSLKVLKDQPPVVRISQPATARTELLPPPADSAETPHMSVEAIINDDYAVAEAHLVATVARGTGEAVKFREQSIPFDVNANLAAEKGSPALRKFSKTLDLPALGLEPGDELYFYVEASDNRQPTANRARSETRFISLKGPETQTATAGRGMAGVNLVPQYFRSQRQIIIDTEKLIADRPTLADAVFRQRANDLGIDQQLLRLRYGQFLGEELEQGQGAGDHQEVALNPLQRGITAGVPSDMVHQHDTAPSAANDPRAGARMALRLKLEHEEQARGGNHDHDGPSAPTGGAKPTAEQIVAPFVDQHDKQDEATFFDHETKSTLRDALAAMWDAEKFLRTARPNEALPPENVALTILKNIQQSARSYVQRVGFESPPLRENERRLKGDVSDVRNRNVAIYSAPAEDAAIAQIRAILRGDFWSDPTRLLSTNERETLRRIEPALTVASTRQPEIFLDGLRVLRGLLTDQTLPLTQTELALLQRTLLRLLPPVETKLMPPSDPASALAAPYFDALAQPVNTP